MGDLKLLKFPKHDPILSRIRTIEDSLYFDNSGEILDELLVVLINWHCSMLDEIESDELQASWQKLSEARNWLMEYYSDSIELGIIEGDAKGNPDNIPSGNN